MILPVDDKDEAKVLKEVSSDAISRTHQFFSGDTPLAHAEEHGGRPYERREQQEQMAFAVAEALEQNHNLCVEAPTGVGKSFAYLVPAIFHAMSMRQPVLITTETINLQEQLVEKDLPLLKELTGLDFTFVIAKGRSHYICRRRLALARGDYRDELIPNALLTTDLTKIADWVSTAPVSGGSRSDIPFKVDSQLWQSICCETTNCKGPKCPYFHNCFYWRVRHQWDKANIVVTNHALFFTDLKIREIEKMETCPLPNYCAVIFDEAHTLEDNAANHLGIHVNSYALRYLLNRMFNPNSGRGLLSKPGEAALQLRGQLARLHDTADGFFSQYQNGLERAADQCLRIMHPEGYQDGLSAALTDFARVLKDFADDQENNDFKMELSSQQERFLAYSDEISQFVSMALPDQVYWVEGQHSSSAAQRGLPQPMELTSAPLNVAELLYNILFSKNIPIVLTSATLAVRDSLDYFVQRIGFGRGEGLILDSPFDYRQQVKLYLTSKMPQPTEQDYNDAAADRIKEFVLKTHGRAFVLFTSYGMLKKCAEKLEVPLRSAGIEVLVHGDAMSRSAMLTQFKRNRGAVIFGATSFWTGVDVPGDALSNVIITKLPFSVPTHPLIAARCDRIRQYGGDPFRDYSIPDAVLKFRQGIGRLIRSKTDTGIIVVLDPRIVSRHYGRAFLNSIPCCPIEYF